MDETKASLPAPRIHECEGMIIVGLKKRYNGGTSAQMPDQWQAFQPYIGNIDTQIGDVAFGIMSNSDRTGTIDYLTGVEVEQIPDVMEGLDTIQLLPQTYAIFKHDSHVSQLKGTWEAIFADWRPQANCALSAAPQFERYGESFDPQSGLGGIEIWIPITI